MKYKENDLVVIRSDLKDGVSYGYWTYEDDVAYSKPGKAVKIDSVEVRSEEHKCFYSSGGSNYLSDEMIDHEATKEFNEWLKGVEYKNIGELIFFLRSCNYTMYNYIQGNIESKAKWLVENYFDLLSKEPETISSKFITPVAMKVTQEQYEEDLQGALRDLGYDWVDSNYFSQKYEILVTDYTNEDKKGLGLWGVKFTHIEVEEYNPELFLALAAMTEGEEWTVGEWLYYMNGKKYFKVKELKGANSIFGGAGVKNTHLYRKATVEELFNYFKTKEMKDEEYKGDLKGFPKEVVEKMLEYQVKQGNKRDVSVFENAKDADKLFMGFKWAQTVEGHPFWRNVIKHGDFDLFFKEYSKEPWKAYKEGDYVVVTELHGKKAYRNWFMPNEVLKLGGSRWKGSLKYNFEAISKNNPTGNGMGYSFEQKYKLRHATKEEILNSYFADEYKKGMKKEFPEKWVVRGTSGAPDWFFDIIKTQKDGGYYSDNPNKGTLDFVKKYYYGEYDFWNESDLPEVYTEVTLEELKEHYKIKDATTKDHKIIETESSYNWRGFLPPNHLSALRKNPSIVKTSDVSDYIKSMPYFYTGGLADVPKTIVALMIREQVLQGNAPNFKVFEGSIASNKDGGGFNWEDTEQGATFWNFVTELKFNVLSGEVPFETLRKGDTVSVIMNNELITNEIINIHYADEYIEIRNYEDELCRIHKNYVLHFEGRDVEIPLPKVAETVIKNKIINFNTNEGVVETSSKSINMLILNTKTI